MQEAIDWVKRCPNPMNEDSDIEIRPLFESEDFGEAFTPELREQEAAILATTYQLEMPTFKLGPDMMIAGLNRSYTAESRVAIPQQWEQFVSQAKSIPGAEGTTYYGVCWNTKPNCEFDYLTGVEIATASKLPPQFTSLKLIAKRYAVFPHSKHVSMIPKTIDAIWTKWVPNCGLKVAEAPCFERYTSEFNPATGMGGMEIWIPLNS
jgi:AraC family transcriptional regulator